MPAHLRRYCSIVLLGILGSAHGAFAEPVRSLIELRHENVVIQQWDLSCGAAALTTLLRFQHDHQVTEKEVALGLINRPEYLSIPELLRVREGFSLFDLKRYAESLGYDGVGYGQLTLEDLIQHAPILVPIDTLGYNHFVVFRGRIGNRVLLADPAWGNRTMTVERFQRAWIEYPEIQHVGFVVKAPSGERPSIERLAPRSDHFLTFN